MPTSLRPQEPLLPCPKNSGAVLRSGCQGEQELEHSSAWLTPGFHGWKQRLGACCFYKLPAPHTVPWALPVLPVSLWKTSSIARKGSSPSPSSSSSGQPWWLGDRRDLPEGLSWEVPGEAALEPAPSFPWLQVPGGFGGALCSPVPSPRTGNSSGNGQDVSSSRVSGRPCLWLRLSLLSFAFEAA